MNRLRDQGIDQFDPDSDESDEDDDDDNIDENDVVIKPLLLQSTDNSGRRPGMATPKQKSSNVRGSSQTRPRPDRNGGASINESSSNSEGEGRSKNPFDEGEHSPRSDRQDPRLLCGLFGWRPACLQPLANMYVFATFVGISYFFSGMARMSLSAQLVSIERQFNIDSSRSGLFTSAAHLGHMTTVLLVGHFARSINIPQAVGWAGIVNGILVLMPSVLEIAMPYRLPQMAGSDSMTQSARGGNNNHHYLCFPNQSMSMGVEDISLAEETKGAGQGSDLLAYYVLMASLYLQGVVNSFRYGSLPFIYIDDNILDKTRTGIFIAITFVLAEFTGPVGDVVNSWLSSVPVDLSNTSMQQDDPRFVSAWWLSFLIFGSLTTLSSIPILFLPRYMVPKPMQDHALHTALKAFAGGGHSAPTGEGFGDENVEVSPPLDIGGSGAAVKYRRLTDEDGEDEEENHSIPPPAVSPKLDCCSMLKDIPQALRRTFSSPLFTLLAVELAVIYTLVFGIHPFSVKYIMFEYNVSMAKTNLAKGLSSAITHIAGTSISSYVSTKIKTRQGYIKLVLLTSLLTLCIKPLYIVFGCDNQKVVGLQGEFGMNNTFFGSSLNSTDCDCDPKDNLLSCGSDGFTYLSPCYAGCLKTDESGFSSCGLMEPDALHSNNSHHVEPGVCEVPCWRNFILYNVLQATSTFIFSINNMPRHLLSLRILHPEDRALGNALLHFLPYLASLPAPLLYGSFIESMCLVWSSDHCSLYNRDSIRYLYGSIEIATATVTSITYWIMLLMCRRLDQQVLLKQRTV